MFITVVTLLLLLESSVTAGFATSRLFLHDLLKTDTPNHFNFQLNSSMKLSTLTERTPETVSLEIKDPVDPKALEQAKAILSEIKGENCVDKTKLVEVATRLGDIASGGSLIATKEDCKKAFESLPEEDRKSLVNIHNRVKVFAEAQRKSVSDLEIDIPGGKAGHTVSPCRGENNNQLHHNIIFIIRCNFR